MAGQDRSVSAAHSNRESKSELTPEIIVNSVRTFFPLMIYVFVFYRIFINYGLIARVPNFNFVNDP